MPREIKNIVLVGEKQENSCRYCCIGAGTHKVIDEDKEEAFYLCDKHRDEYDIENDSIPAPVKESEPEPEPAQ